MNKEELNFEDAMKMVIGFLKNPDHGSFAKYGYGFYLPNVVRTYLRKQGRDQEAERLLENWSPVLYEVAWELCLRGILRPGIKKHGGQATDDGNAGNGYSITALGKKWLEETDQHVFIPTEPDRFGQLLAPYNEKFGEGFHERGQQAIRCYSARAYLACCAMCGASAESIMLAVAIKKSGDEQDILKRYSSRNGRQDVENFIIGKARKDLQDNYKSYMVLLKYWRDEAAHGKASNIRENEAYTALLLLLRFAMLVNDNWNELV